jgi:urease gamma subunit
VQSEKIINPDTPHEVSHWILEISRKGQALQRQEEIKQRVKNMIEHVKHVQSRIDAYASFAQSELSELKKQQSEGLKDKFQALITTLATIARRASSAGSSAGYPAQIAELSENMLKQVFGGASPETLSEFANKLSTIGETQDKAISFCRMATQWVRQLARMISPVSPEQKSLLERIVLKADSSLSAM